MKNNLSILCVSIFLSSCVTLSDKAASIQVHTQLSGLLDDCEKLGPVTGVSDKFPPGLREDDAFVKIREATDDLGGDSVAVINTDVTRSELRIHGTALKCY